MGRIRAGSVVVMMAASVLVAPAVATAAPPAAVTDTDTALAAATRSGQRVEVSSARSDRSRLWAEPSGSLSVESWLVPRWARRADGTWADIDTRLRKLPDGTLAPHLSTVDLTVSGGGEGPFATLRRDGHTFSLAWPGRLPQPVVSGDTATYADVRSDVDLVVRATATGFSHVLVVRSATAATDPALRRIRLAVGGDTTLSTTADGGLIVSAGSGVLASAAGPVMWDSLSARGVLADTPDAGRSSARGPAVGSRQAGVGVQVSGRELVLIPDVALLASGAFPIFVDPDFSANNPLFAYANDTNTNWTLSDPEPSPGDIGGGQLWSGFDREQGRRYRGFVQFPMISNGMDLRGRRIFSAKLAGTVDHTFRCEPFVRQVNFFRTAAIATTPRQNWPGPALQHQIGTLWAAANEQSCSNGNQAFEIGLTSDVQAAATAGLNSYTVGVVPQSEGDENHWFRFFRNSFYLLASFNSAPNVATEQTTETKACSTGSARAYVGTTTPQLRARVFDVDGDVDLSAEYAFDHWNSTTSAWDRVLGTTKTGIASNTFTTLELGVDPGAGAVLVSGHRYRWTVLVIDPWPGGSDPAGWAPWCEFQVDTVRPAAIPDVSSPVYLQDGNYNGGIGLTADFRFAPNGDNDIAGFQYGWADPPTTFAAASATGAALTLPITPPPPDPANPTIFGQLTLYVQNVDRAGNKGDPRQYQFLIGSASLPVAVWNLADAGGATSLVDSSGNNHHATPTAVTAGGAGRLLAGPAQTAPTAATFNGTTSTAATGASVVDTSTSFSISAWVRPDANTNGWRTFLSAKGTHASSFFLRRDPTNRWTFTTVRFDSATAAAQTDLASTSISQPGVWTHVAAVYDEGAQQIRLFVNGVPEASATVAGVFNATGPIEFGRDLWEDNPNLHATWHGGLSEVRLWSRALVVAEIAPVVATRVGWWTLNGHGFDDSGWGRHATATAITWVNDRAASPQSAAGFNGTTSGLATTGPAVRSDQSYTVALWVRFTGPNVWADAVAQKGVRESALILQREPNVQKWAMAAHLTDTDNPITARALSNGSATNGWTHLVGVYDAQARQLKLYVNGAVQQTVAYTATWHANGPVLFGYDWHNGVVVSRWIGDIDDVRIFAGAMTASEISKLHQQ